MIPAHVSGNGRLAEANDERGYYGVPAIHAAHWDWLVVGYFFFGGISGSAAVIAAIARLFGGKSMAAVVRAGTYVSFAALVPCPVLLILDLGRPRRFLNMLRVFRPSSPMSAGSWGMTAFGAVSTLAAGVRFLEDRGLATGQRSRAGFRAAAGALAIAAAPLGFLIAGYTGVLLAATAVPLWAKRPGLLGALFVTSAMTSGAAAVSATLAIADGDVEDGLLRFEAMAGAAEGVLLTAWVFALGQTARPLVEGRIGTVVRHGVIGGGVAIPLLIGAATSRLPRRARRAATIVSALFTLTGTLALRYAVVYGGRESANDPRATFDLTG